ncbi:hypothetical protein ANSO36C_26920 [Nostoc cf. commune SO-36]|uniref:Transposase n=1 Tax=Nostoc cf. commune SO-36 TaxID=449208 RepID=A0ABM7Z1S9_NOSCO|nr:hypothetical protein ANSO36C_26920 [Nostoc cf. commune SO-36]
MLLIQGGTVCKKRKCARQGNLRGILSITVTNKEFTVNKSVNRKMLAINKIKLAANIA